MTALMEMSTSTTTTTMAVEQSKVGGCARRFLQQTFGSMRLKKKLRRSSSTSSSTSICSSSDSYSCNGSSSLHFTADIAIEGESFSVPARKNVRFQENPQVRTYKKHSRAKSSELWWTKDELTQLKRLERSNMDKTTVCKYIQYAVSMYKRTVQHHEQQLQLQFEQQQEQQVQCDMESEDSSHDSNDVDIFDNVLSYDTALHLYKGLDAGFRGLEILETKTGHQRNMAWIDSVKNVVLASKALKQSGQSTDECAEALRARYVQVSSARDRQYAHLMGKADEMAVRY